MTAPEPSPTAEHIDADHHVANLAQHIALSRAWALRSPHGVARDLLTSTDPAVHLAMLAALVRAGVLTPEDAPIARHGGYEHTHWQQRWDGQHTHEGRRFVTSWEVAP